MAIDFKRGQFFKQDMRNGGEYVFLDYQGADGILVEWVDPVFRFLVWQDIDECERITPVDYLSTGDVLDRFIRDIEPSA